VLAIVPYLALTFALLAVASTIYRRVLVLTG
jgi:hypothetical protein